VIGAAPARPLTRSGARPGEGLFVTGTLGSAALGLALLKRGQPTRAPEHVARWRVPTARIAEGRRAVEHASAGIDVSDGLLQDLRHLCTASSVGCEIDLVALPRPREDVLAAELGLDLEQLALAGGEDYELLIAASEPPAGAGFTRIGTFTSAAGVRLREATGAVRTAEIAGFDHFD
jgi:thiamine-monophosphate kinase